MLLEESKIQAPTRKNSNRLRIQRLQIASASSDKTVRFWDVSITEAYLYTDDLSNSLLRVTCSPDGQVLASGSHAGVYNGDTGVPDFSLRCENMHAECVAYSSSGHQISMTGFDKTVRLWHADSGAASHVLWGVNKAISGDAAIRLSFASNGLELAARF
ncbi:MAG: hypothetical protein J3R72DRAFT_497817 [Linnemannia gamsii]|nr:MAG: hypothetical protein J3R72DRAFT_497817 [Linnemannia gamsii]